MADKNITEFFEEREEATNIAGAEMVALQDGEIVRVPASLLPENNNQGGENGLSAYELYQQEGGLLSLNDWLDSLIGSDGANGENGADGSNGIDGANGIDGVDGVDGSDGQDGEDGEDGSDGQDGEDGLDGQNGADGVVDGITLNNQAKKALEYLEGYQTFNFFNKEDLQDGIISNGTSEVVSPASNGEKVSNPIYLSAGWYSYYGVGDDYSFEFFHYTQIFDNSGVYQSTFQTFGNENAFEMLVDGYVIIDYNNKVTGDSTDIFLGQYNPLFSTAANESTFFIADVNNGYTPILSDLPVLKFEKTDNILDITTIQESIDSNVVADYMIVLDVPAGEEYVSIRDNFPMSETTNPFITEYDDSGNIVGSFIVGNKLSEDTRFLKHKLNPLAVKISLNFYLTSSAARWGGEFLTPLRIKENLRVNFGGYFTNETSGQKLESANNFDVNYTENPIKGVKLAALGDSITIGVNPVATSYLDVLSTDHEVFLRNYAVGSAGLTDWTDTEVTTSVYSQTDNSGHNNVLSNQFNLMVSEGFVPDAVVIGGGTNDSFRSRISGDLQLTLNNYSTPDNLNREEVYGATLYMITKVREVNPKCEIFVTLPIRTVEVDNVEGVNLELTEIRDAMRDIAQATGCQIVDFKNTLNNIDLTLPSTDYVDFLHPSLYGISKMSYEFLNSITKVFN